MKNVQLVDNAVIAVLGAATSDTTEVEDNDSRYLNYILNDSISEKIKSNRIEARRRIASLIGKEVGDDLIYKEINMVASSLNDAVSLISELKTVMGKIIAGTAVAGDLTSTAITDLESSLTTSRGKLNSVNAIISTENTAATSINNAETQAEVDAISVSWPSELLSSTLANSS